MFRRCRDNNPPGEQLSIFPNIIMMLSVLDDGHNGKIEACRKQNSTPCRKKKKLRNKWWESLAWVLCDMFQSCFCDKVGNSRASEERIEVIFVHKPWFTYSNWQYLNIFTARGGSWANQTVETCHFPPLPPVWKAMGTHCASEQRKRWAMSHAHCVRTRASEPDGLMLVQMMLEITPITEGSDCYHVHFSNFSVMTLPPNKAIRWSSTTETDG